MMRGFKTEGVILKKRVLLNKDVVISIFTKERGKIILFAKGIRKITSRRLPHTETGNLINVLISEKNDRLFLQETSLISAFSQIKKDPIKINYLYAFLFILERLLPENQQELPIYQLTVNFLVDLSKKPFNNSNLNFYINDLLIALGYLKEKKSFDQIRFIIEEIINEKIPSHII